MNALYVKKFYYQELTRSPEKTPRERFKRYYDDLMHAEQQLPIDCLSYQRGSQYDYVALVTPLLNKIVEEGYLIAAQLLVRISVGANAGFGLQANGDFGFTRTLISDLVEH